MALNDAQRSRFGELVRSDAVVLFMKGNRHFPQCGFSAQVVGILDQLTPSYKTVNILEDPAVREGMKEFSSWPTFPQLYVKGDFVGGCDIVKDLFASGELQKLIGGAGVAKGSAKTTAEAPAITVTAAASEALRGALSDGGDDVVRLEIDPAFAVDLHVAPAAPGDVEVKAGGVSLFVGASSVRRAAGLSIDYIDGPNGPAFKIHNPNEPPRVKRIGPKDLKTMLDAGQVQLYDVRPDEERALASLKQATKLDASSQERLLGLPKDTAIAFHCHHGGRSRAAAEALLREGFTNVYNMEGGIDAWSMDVDPSVPRY